MHLSADWAGDSVAWLQSHKVNTGPLLDRLGIDRRDLNFGQQVPARHFATILDYGAVKTKDAHFNLGERTLRRRLQAAHVSFAELLDRVRLKLANDWLTRSDFDLKHISFLLGYSEPAAFSRAYKRWTGRPPGLTRARRRRAKASP